MAKKLYLIRAQYDGGRSDFIASQLTASGLTFTSLTYSVDPLPWQRISYVPCVVIDVDGDIYKIHEDRDKGYNNAQLVADWNAAPATIVKSGPVLSDQDRDKQLADAIIRKGGHNLSVADTNTLIALMAKYIFK